MNKKGIVTILLALAVLCTGIYFFTRDNASTNLQNEDGSAQGKIDINAVCEGALAYMTFPDGESADTFVAECKEGKHPDVIERYKESLNLGDESAI